MLTRIRNGIRARHDYVDIPASRLKMEIARILKDEGFVADWHRIDRGPQGVLRITLKYGPRKETVLSGLTRVSRPSLGTAAARGGGPARDPTAPAPWAPRMSGKCAASHRDRGACDSSPD